MKRLLIVILVTLVVLSALLLMVLLGVPSFMALPSHLLPQQTLDVALTDTPTHYDFKVGQHQVDIVLQRTPPRDDNGKVRVLVSIDGVQAASAEAFYDYDMWSHKAPVSYRWLRFDVDASRDLILRLNHYHETIWVVGSERGRLYSFTPLSE